MLSDYTPSGTEDSLPVLSWNGPLSFRCLLGITCIVACTVLEPRLASSEELRPANILLLIADDLGYGELGCQGNSEIATPAIDALAASGVRLTQAYVTAPNCSPSRAGIFSGRTPTRFGYEFNPIGARNDDPGTGFPTTQPMLAEQLHRAGYTTALIGKWHLGGAPDYHPLRRGFDEFFGFLHEGHFYVPPPWREVTTMLRRKAIPDLAAVRFNVSDRLIYSSHMGHGEPPYDANNPILRGGQPVVETEYLTDALTREAVDFIGRNAANPFFLCLAYNAVHSPLQAKNETLKKFSGIEDIHRRIFAAMLADLDRSVGDVVAALDKHQLREHTMVIFLSDNGGPTRELTSSNLPLRGGKGTMYEGGLRVPFLVSMPSMLPAGTTSNRIASSLDILPTAANLAGVPASEAWEGQDLLQLLNDASLPSRHQVLFWRQGNRSALRIGDWKIVDNSPASDRSWELYNVGTDIAETQDHAAEQSLKLRSMIQVWEKLNSEMQQAIF